MPRCADASCVRWRPAFGVWGGVRLNGTWFCSRACAATAVRRGLESPPAVGESAGSLPPLRIGALLRHQGAITQAQLDEALASQRKSGLRLGAELQRLGFVTSARSHTASSTRYGSAVHPVSRAIARSAGRGSGAVQITRSRRSWVSASNGSSPSARTMSAYNPPGARRTRPGSTEVM